MNRPPAWSIVGMEILLIEDDLVDAKTVQRVFTTHGAPHQLRVVNGGGAALDYLLGRGDYIDQGKPGRPGLILLDLNMPGMTGLEFLGTIKDDPVLRRIPVIVLSTSDLESDILASYEGGVAGYFVKPLEYTQFVGTVQSILRYWELCQHPLSLPATSP
jgi:CheY-like chemotaxis protein